MSSTNEIAEFSVSLEGRAHECGTGDFHLSSEIRDVIIGQSRVPVLQTFFQCSGCGEERQTLTQLGEARSAAADIVREREQLLVPEEIRRIREERLRLTQAQFESALGLGAKTVVRWETGRVMHPKATDNLLRLLDRDPSALHFLADRHGVHLPSEPFAIETSEHFGESTERQEDCAIVIPRKFQRNLEDLAAREGSDLRTYVAWLLAEQLTAAKLGVQLQALHADVAGLRRSMQTWAGFTFVGASSFAPSRTQRIAEPSTNDALSAYGQLA